VLLQQPTMQLFDYPMHSFWRHGETKKAPAEAEKLAALRLREAGYRA